MENVQLQENPGTASAVVQPAAEFVEEAVPRKRAVIIVFWLEDGMPMSHGFGGREQSEALKLAEVQRKRRAAGELISHVCLSSEHEDSVGLPGVSDKLPENYDWTKQDRAGKTRRR